MKYRRETGSSAEINHLSQEVVVLGLVWFSQISKSNAFLRVNSQGQE